MFDAMAYDDLADPVHSGSTPWLPQYTRPEGGYLAYLRTDGLQGKHSILLRKSQYSAVQALEQVWCSNDGWKESEKGFAMDCSTFGVSRVSTSEKSALEREDGHLQRTVRTSFQFWLCFQARRSPSTRCLPPPLALPWRHTKRCPTCSGEDPCGAPKKHSCSFARTPFPSTHLPPE
jgi:hypothetical protein